MGGGRRERKKGERSKRKEKERRRGIEEEARCARGRGDAPSFFFSTSTKKPYQKKRRRLKNLKEEYIREEQRSLKRELLRAQEEVKRIQSVPLVIGQFLEMIDSDSGIVGSTTGSNYHVRVLSTINRELLRPSASVALHRHSNALVDGE